ncbi:MAG: hypothetical protein WCN98_01575 [Verrucomicrobiaceae bacterium]
MKIKNVAGRTGMLICISGMFIASHHAGAQITTRSDATGKLLNRWFEEGSAAGLGTVTYENRDNGHSLFRSGEWPQLKVYSPSNDGKAVKQESGLASSIRPQVLFGNCSMAAPAEYGGSLPRIYEVESAGFAFLLNQYQNNNLFFYPAHQDHNPGWNGLGGWGDMFVANTPYIVVSQGSSYTDQPFVQAFISAAAALPHDTQRSLISSQLLMPALQCLFRRSNKMVRNDDDYFTGRAHPPVFRGSDIDEEKFVRLAHNLPPLAVPPVAMLEVKQETPEVIPGRDFFELPAVKNEKLADTPCAIARIMRGSAFRREMTVSAARSVDPLQRTLLFKWVLLQGDPKRVKIEPAADGAEARITVHWHPELAAASGLVSHRVDIGVFAGNGISWSAPSFITFYMLPNESRSYREDGRLEEICYDSGNPHIGMPQSNDLRWLRLCRRLSSDVNAPGIELLRHVLPKEDLAKLQTIADEFAPRQEEWRRLTANDQKKTEAEAVLRELQESLSRRLETAGSGGVSLHEAMEKALGKIANAPDLFVTLQQRLKEQSWQSPLPDLDAAVHRVMDYQLLERTSSEAYKLCVNAASVTGGERARLRELNLTILSTALLPEFLERSNKPAFVDPRLTSPKSWRDVYQYDKAGACTGWTRITNGRSYEFNSDGHLLPDGRGGRALAVKLIRDDHDGRLVFAPL